MNSTEMVDMEERPIHRIDNQPEGEPSRKHAWLALLGCSLLQLPIWGMSDLQWFIYFTETIKAWR